MSLLKEAKKIILANSTIKDKHILDKYRWYEKYLKEILKENNIDYNIL